LQRVAATGSRSQNLSEAITFVRRETLHVSSQHRSVLLSRVRDGYRLRAASKGAAPAAKVKGTVNLDGNPLPAGEVHFTLAGYPPKKLIIANGSFDDEAPIGQNQVEVFVFVDGPPSEKYKGVVRKVNTVSEKFWGPNTTLKADVQKGGANQFKFDVTTNQD
jgi:hypothetical protein